MPVAFTALTGLVVGSFLNVVAYRLPRRESLVSPGSRCPGCGTAIKPYDNLPVLGWLLLRGRCRGCHDAISPRYPLVEAISAVLAVAVLLTHRSLSELVLGLLLVAVLVPIALIDLDHRLIPNRITLPAGIAALAVGGVLHPSGLPEQLISGAAAGGFLLFFALAYPAGLGMGDVKLAALLGLFLGRYVGVALIVALFSATAVGVGVMVRLGVARGRKTALPFGPFLALGGVVGLLAGPSLLHWYLHSVL